MRMICEDVLQSGASNILSRLNVNSAARCRQLHGHLLMQNLPGLFAVCEFSAGASRFRVQALACIDKATA